MEICQSLEATEYYAALGSSRYLNLSMFREKSIRVSFQHFRYSAGPDPLRPSDYSVLDWLALEPLEKIRERLGKNRGSALLAKSAEISIDGDMRPVNRLIH